VSPRLRLVAARLVLVGLVVAVYAATLGYGFVFDDQALIVDNPAVRLPLSSAGRLLDTPRAGIVYRPLRTFSYMLDRTLAGGLAPAFFHAMNVAYHALAVLVLFALAHLVLGSLGGAFAAAALFAVHPLNVEAVAYVSGRRDLLCGLLSLTALWFWRRFVVADVDSTAPSAAGTGTRSFIEHLLGVTGMLVAGILALAAKEEALVLPALACLILPLSARGRATRAVGGAGWLALLCFAALASLVAWRIYGQTLVLGLARARSGPLAPQPALTVDVLARYLRLAIWPVGLSADYSTGAYPLPQAPLDGGALASGLGLLLFVGGALWLLVRGFAAGAGMLWFLVALLPVAQIVPYKEVIAEHNAYLPLAGLAIAAGGGFAALGEVRPLVTRTVLPALLLLLAVGATLRTRVWETNLSLWSATAAAHPLGMRAQYNLGIAHLQAGSLDQARSALGRAHELDRNDRDVLLALASVEGKLGNFARSVELASRAIAERADADSLTLLGWSQLNAGDADEAVATFKRALALSPESPDAKRGLSLARLRAAHF